MPGNATVTRRNNCNFEFEFLGQTTLSGIFYSVDNDSYAHAVSPPGNVCTGGAGDRYFKS